MTDKTLVERLRAIFDALDGHLGDSDLDAGEPYEDDAEFRDEDPLCWAAKEVMELLPDITRLEAEKAERADKVREWVAKAATLKSENMDLAVRVQTIEKLHAKSSNNALDAHKEVGTLRARIAELEAENATAYDKGLETMCKICDSWQRTETLEECCDAAQDSALKSVATLGRSLKKGKQS